MGVKKVSYDNLSKAGKWMRNNPSKVKDQPSRTKPLSTKEEVDLITIDRACVEYMYSNSNKSSKNVFFAFKNKSKNSKAISGEIKG